MEAQKENYSLLDLMLRPAFRVRDGRIQQANAAALALNIAEGTSITELLHTGQEEYTLFDGGCLYLQLCLSGQILGATLTRLEDMDVFLLEPEGSELQAMALAARELREPLGNLMAISGCLLPGTVDTEDPKVRELLARMSKGLYQMQRILGNMADAGQSQQLSFPEVRNVTQVFADIFEKAGAMLESAGIRLSYEGPNQDIFCPLDAYQMERAVLNMLSNSAKFLPEGGQIRAALTRTGSILRLTVQDTGSGIAQEILGSLFSRYLRQPGIEDRRHGLGLGMVMIRAAAASHGGTVLIDHLPDSGTRISLTMKLRQSQGSQVRCCKTILSGGLDQALVELSEILPLSVYEQEL